MGETSGAPGPACCFSAAVEETRHCCVVSKFKDDVRRGVGEQHKGTCAVEASDLCGPTLSVCGHQSIQAQTRGGKSRSVSSRQDGLKCRPAAIISSLTFYPGSSRWFRELRFVGIWMVVAAFQQGAFINIK